MKILVISALAFAVTPELKYGGMERLAWEFAGGFAAEGHEVFLLSSNDTIVPEKVNLMSAMFNATPDLSREYIAAVNNMSIIYDSNFDAILDLSHQHWVPRMYGLKCPSVSVFWHDPYIALFPQPNHNVIALSGWAKDRFEKAYHQSAVVQETILVDSDRYFYDPVVKKEDWFLFLGKMSHEKGALDAISICREKNAALKIIGGKGLDSDPDDYQKEVMYQSIGNIEYLGEVDDDKKIECLQKAKALIYPVNQMEITSHKNIEALMCGCPVITYNRGAMGHTVDHGKTGFLAETREDFLNAMDSINQINPEDCRSIAVYRWSKNNVVKNYLPLLKRVADGERWF